MSGTYDGTAIFETTDDASTGTDTPLDRELGGLKTKARMIAGQLADGPNTLQAENISLYNDWRRLRKLELKATNRRIDEVLRLLAAQRKAKRQQSQEIATLYSPYWHFVELARQQMRPEEFAKAWAYATQKAQEVKADEQ